jgi:hypothetical protein
MLCQRKKREGHLNRVFLVVVDWEAAIASLKVIWDDESDYF